MYTTGEYLKLEPFYISDRLRSIRFYKLCKKLFIRFLNLQRLVVYLNEVISYL